MEALILIILLVNLMFTGGMIYFVAVQRQEIQNIEKKVLGKVKGISKKDQKNIDQIKEAIEQDVNDTLNFVKEGNGSIDIPDFPQLESLLNSPGGSDVLGGALGSVGWFDIIMPLISANLGSAQGTSNVLSMLNNSAVQNMAVAGIGLKLFQALSAKRKPKPEDEYVIEPFKHKAKNFQSKF